MLILLNHFPNIPVLRRFFDYLSILCASLAVLAGLQSLSLDDGGRLLMIVAPKHHVLGLLPVRDRRLFDATVLGAGRRRLLTLVRVGVHELLMKLLHFLFAL